MSETLCTLRTKGGGGGKYTETSLWTNSAPSSSFATQTVTLSQSISNFKYVMFKVAYATNTLNQTWSLIAKVSDFITATQSNSVPNYILAERNTSGTMRYRSAYYVSDTSIKFDTATGSDANLIPLEILGLNELAHKTVISMDLIGEISLPASTSTVTGTLTQNISDYKNLFITMTAYNGSTLPTTGTNSPPLQFVDTDYFASNNIVGYYTAGNAGAMTAYSVTMQKLSDTSIKFTRSNTSGNRTAYVYGIK